MTHASALRGCLAFWHADAGLPADRLRPARRQGVTEGALLRSVFEQGSGHKIILPSLAVRSPRICRGSVAELATSDVEPLLAVGAKRRYLDFQHVRLPCHPRSSRACPARSAIGLCRVRGGIRYAERSAYRD